MSREASTDSKESTGHLPEEVEGGDAMFPHVGRWSRGYEPDQVDLFFARARIAYEGPLEASMPADEVRNTSFDLTRGGYTPSVVDDAMDRLEAAFYRRERAAFVALNGMGEWKARTERLLHTLQPRAARPAGVRFARPAHGPGYRAADVDALVDRIIARFASDAPLTSDEIRAASFGNARGRAAYAEGPVDAYLDRALQVLLAVE